MEPCTGCRFLVLTSTRGVCRATDGPVVYTLNPLTNRYEPKIVWRPTVTEQRAEGAPCGPDRKLYQPTLWARLWAWWQA